MLRYEQAKQREYHSQISIEERLNHNLYVQCGSIETYGNVYSFIPVHESQLQVRMPILESAHLREI